MTPIAAHALSSGSLIGDYSVLILDRAVFSSLLGCLEETFVKTLTLVNQAAQKKPL